MAVINLNQYRKRKQREQDKQAADENAIRHGRSKADRVHDAAQRKRLDDAVDGAKLPDDDEAEDPDEPEK